VEGGIASIPHKLESVRTALYATIPDKTGVLVNLYLICWLIIYLWY